ncbi:MAG: pentapeptide repeat-containing protein [Sphingomonadales bacterium]|nr:pentapeptide repeat-containing protein [Sphingomonadales bacterium]
MAPKKPMTRAPAVKKPKAKTADPRVARVLAHAEANRKAGQEEIALPDDLTDLSGIDLSNADLSGAYLSGIDLRNANLAGANLQRAYLSGADFYVAKLIGADLRGADLSDAKLTGANLSDADIENALLDGANFVDADLTRAVLRGADLSGADLSGAKLTGADLLFASLTGADLRDADLTDANISDADLSDAILFRAYLRRANLSGAKLSGADLGRANLSGADLSGADISDANLTGANLIGANLIGANLTRTDLSGADLRDAILTDADMTDADLSKAKNVSLPRLGPLKEQYKIEAPSSAAFTRWFGQSVVVGDRKKPIVVYHGTTRGGFTVFDPDAKDAHHRAFYFTDNAEVAETYIDMALPQERPDPALTKDAVGIYRLYIRLVNPMIVEGNGCTWDNLRDPRAPGLRKTYELATWAEKNGHDGVIFKDIVDDGEQGARDAVAATVYAVFDPRAIKSATANNGNYDPNDPDIRHNPLIKPSKHRGNSWHRRNR